MRLLKQLFSKATIVNHAKRLAESRQKTATAKLAFISPATGMMQAMGATTLERFQNKMTGDGIMILPHGSKIVLPVSGIVTQSSTQQITIRVADQTEVVMAFGGVKANCGQLATYSEKQQLWAGDIVGTIADSALDHSGCIELYIIWPGCQSPRVNFGMVYASQSVRCLPETLQNGVEAHD